MQKGAQYGAPTAVCWAGSVVASGENAQLFLWTPRNPPDPSQDSSGSGLCCVDSVALSLSPALSDMPEGRSPRPWAPEES